MWVEIDNIIFYEVCVYFVIGFNGIKFINLLFYIYLLRVLELVIYINVI